LTTMKSKSPPKRTRKRHLSTPKPELKRPRKAKAPPATWTALAEILGVTRQALNVHKRRLGPDAPALGDVDGWTIALAAHDSREGTAPKAIREQIARARLRLLIAASGREENRLAKERGQMLDKTVTGQAVAGAVSLFFFNVERLFENELPPLLAGLDALAIHKHLTEASSRLKSDLRAGLEALLEGKP
jgi:hypothetical protein